MPGKLCEHVDNDNKISSFLFFFFNQPKMSISSPFISIYSSNSPTELSFSFSHFAARCLIELKLELTSDPGSGFSFYSFFSFS